MSQEVQYIFANARESAKSIVLPPPRHNKRKNNMNTRPKGLYIERSCIFWFCSEMEVCDTWFFNSVTMSSSRELCHLQV